MKTKKGLKTTIAAIIAGLLYTAVYVFKLLDWIDLETFEAMEKSLIIGVPIIIGFLAKDWNASHTKDPGHPTGDDDD